MPSPEPNYAQRAQNCEQERDILRIQLEQLSTVDNSPTPCERYKELVNTQAALLRQNEIQLSAMRTDNVRLREQAEAATRRATQAEDKLTEARIAMLKCDTFMNDLRNTLRGRL